MAISIKDPEADRLAREVAAMTHQSITGAIVEALSEKLARERAKRAKEIARRKKAVEKIVAQVKRLKVLDNRSADEILGYDENGLPT